MLKASSAMPNRIQPREKWNRGRDGEAPLGAGGGAFWGRSGVATLRLLAPASLAPDRGAGQQGNREREQPPRVDLVVGQDRHERERERDTRSHRPVVAHDEIPPELAEGLHVSHALASASLSSSRRRLSAHTISHEQPPRKAISASSESSSPGQSAPAPSAPQKQPKLVSSRPTANLMVFSGTRCSGPRARTPATTTTTSATTAATIATSSRPCALPNVITMKTTSSPSSRTPLKAMVKEYQSSPARRSLPAASASARSRRNASSSSCSGL